MTKIEALTQHSNGIADKLAKELEFLLSNNRKQLISYYSNDATLYFQGVNYNGEEEITNFYDNMGKIEIKINAYDAQTIQAPGSWTMIVFTGTCTIGDFEKIFDFHSVIYTDADENLQTALIRYHSFNYF